MRYDKLIIYIDILAKRDHIDAASKKPATKKAAKKTQVGFEESLWDAANKLRSNSENLLLNIRQIVEQVCGQVKQTVNTSMLQTYWQIAA